MSADYPSAQEHFVPRSFMFNSNAQKAIVIHKTGGDATPQAVYNTFLGSGNPGKSAHYAVGQDGSIWQFVPESLGAGANGITDATTDPFWFPYMQQYGNLNTCTISIEHCDSSPRNDTPLTPAQKQASFALVAHLCQKYNIPASHIKPHRSVCATDCPGTYPMDELIAHVQQGEASWMNQYQEAQALATWQSTTYNAISVGGNAKAASGIFPAGGTPPYDTGIAKAWQRDYMNGQNHGAPVSYEYGQVNGVQLTDWAGNPIVQQNFYGGRYEWSIKTSVATWYPWK